MQFESLKQFFPFAGDPFVKDESNFSIVDRAAVIKRALPLSAVIWPAVHLVNAMGRMVGASGLIPYPNLLPFVSFALIGAAEWARAQNKANDANIEEYIRSDLPAVRLSRFIVDNKFAIRELIERSADLTKIDESGHSLLYASVDKYDFDIDIFDLLFQSASWPKEEIFKCLMKMAQFRIELLEHVVDKKRVAVSDLTPDQQMTLWLSINSTKAAEILVKMGCNPNIRDAQGFTPLLKTANGHYHCGSALSHARRLIAAGADPRAMAVIGGVQKNALRLAKEAPMKEAELISFFESGSYENPLP